MRLKAILAEAARKRYPLSVMIIIIGILVIPFPYLFIHFGLEQVNIWWSLLGICLGVVLGALIIGLGSLVEDIHDISMHTMGFDLELGELPEDDFNDEDVEDVDYPEEPAPEEEPEEEPSEQE